MEPKSASVGRDERLTLELLVTVANATEGGQPVRSSELEKLPGWTPEQVWRELRLLWDDDLIRCTNAKQLSDPDGKTSLLIHALTPAGWARLEEIQHRYRRRGAWKQYWPAAERWLLATIVPVAVAVCTAALVAWLALG